MLNPKEDTMKTSILALFIFLTGAFAQAQSIDRIYRCEQKHGHHRADIFHEDHKFFVCFYRDMLAANDADPDHIMKCRSIVWSERVDHKDDMIMIDFQRGWMFEGDRKGGVLWNDRTSYMCDFDDHHGHDDDGQGHP
jgi:hypothetical protein